MKKIKITYFSNEDILFIPLKSEKSSVGDEEYQEDVVLFRDTKKEVVGIEIQKFSLFKDIKIQLDKNTSLDFSKAFKTVKMLISLRDIMFSDPIQFEQTLKEWGIDIVKERNDLPKNISIKTELPIEFANC